jgi:hypothetical protein
MSFHCTPVEVDSARGPNADLQRSIDFIVGFVFFLASAMKEITTGFKKLTVVYQPYMTIVISLSSYLYLALLVIVINSGGRGTYLTHILSPTPNVNCLLLSSYSHLVLTTQLLF